MANSKSKSKRAKLLSHSRPPVSVTSSKANKSSNSQSSKSTRTTIRTYHTLEKRLKQARNANDSTLAASIQAELDSLGGLQAYQAASTLGQSAQRGGDTSKVLVEWLAPVLEKRTVERPLRILEVGALSTVNALNILGKTVVRRIDLRSNDPEIEEMNFMALPPGEPWKDSSGYDVLSLSLVVNFVGDPVGRGEMLRHTTCFLQSRKPGRDVEGAKKTSSDGDRNDTEYLLPALFLVLPLPCVDNSRYFTAERLGEMMTSLGYARTRMKSTAKLYYSLWRCDDELQAVQSAREFNKEELRKGKDRNNFCIVLKHKISDVGGCRE